MLQARKVSWWRTSYRLVADSEPLTTWTGRVFRGRQRGGRSARLSLPVRVFVLVVALAKWDTPGASA